MKNSTALAVVTLAFQTVVSFAGPPPSKEVVASPPPPPPVSYFRAKELDIGAFATYGTSFGPRITIGESATMPGVAAWMWPISLGPMQVFESRDPL